MRRAIGYLLVLAAVASSLLALVTAATDAIDPGVVPDESGRIVERVMPGSVAWQAGIRAGQAVLAIVPSSDPGGWSMETTDGTTTYRASTVAAAGLLRLSAAAAIAGAALGLAGLAWIATRRRRAELLASIALLLAGVPYGLADESLVGTVVLVVGPVAAIGWLARWGTWPRSVRAATVLVAVVVSVAWILVRERGDTLAEVVDGARTVMLVGGVAGLAVLGSGMTVDRVMASVGAMRVLDVAAVAVISVVAVGLYLAQAPLLLLLLAIVVTLAGYARARTAVTGLLDRVLLAEMRERVAVTAAEEERARLSRQIHDDPLQAIAGVIQQLEQHPDAEAARESLRSVAANLRNVATNLHPPVLDDLGLAPALEAIARQPTASIPVDVEIVNEAGYTPAERPPADVELALYRIAQEAVANAVNHSAGTRVEIRGRVTPSLIDLDVVDDGVGVGEGRPEAALREGHMGIASMRRRADGIDARLELRPSPSGGTSVHVRWPA